MLLNQGTRRDPTRTTTLRARFIRDMNRRWNLLLIDIRKSIVEQDCFGIQLDRIIPLAATGAREFAFTRTQDKVDAFMRWLEQQQSQGILELVTRPGLQRGTEAAWTDTYIRTAYETGVRRGRQELRMAGYRTTPIESITGGLSGVIEQVYHADRLGVLYTRTFEDLRSVTQFTNAQIRRQISDGLTTGLTRGMAEGKSPRTIARELYKDVKNRVDKIGKVRSRMIARTEIVRAHHIANVQEYRQAEVEGVKVQAEWVTGAGACPICIGFAEDKVYTLDEIEALIPAHPNCGCVAKPIPLLRGRGQATEPQVPQLEPESVAYSTKATLRECEQWAKEHAGARGVYYEQVAPFKRRGWGGKLSQKQALNKFNAVNASIDEFQRRHRIRVPQVDVFYITSNARGRAYGGPAGHGVRAAISFSKEWSDKAWANIRNWEQRTGRQWDWTSSESHISIVTRHEYAHLMDFQHGVTRSARFRELRDRLRIDDKFTAGSISEYAGTNAMEWFAEAMSQYTSPLYGQVKARFPKKLEDFLESVLDKYRRAD